MIASIIIINDLNDFVLDRLINLNKENTKPIDNKNRKMYPIRSNINGSYIRNYSTTALYSLFLYSYLIF